MPNSVYRAVLCTVVGLFAGTFVGFLFVTDPTSPQVPAVALGLGAIVSGGLYLSNWGRKEARVNE